MMHPCLGDILADATTESVMQAQDIATTRVVVTEPDQMIHAAARLMERHLVGCLIVTERRHGCVIPVGILTDRDICLELARDARVGGRTVDAIMSHPVITCPHDATLDEIVQLMRTNQVRRLPVVDACGELTGVVTANDALNALSELVQQLGEVLIVEPSIRDRLTAAESAADDMYGHFA